jgi:hypothetical protein
MLCSGSDIKARELPDWNGCVDCPVCKKHKRIYWWYGGNRMVPHESE